MAKEKTLAAIDHLIERYPALAAMEEPLKAAVEMIVECYRNGGKLLVCGNGGSAADAEHITGELMKGFLLPRRLKEEHRQKLLDACPEDAAYLIEN
ncbi:MAG: SIS domain-containing protein, partial [Selenomonas sp.]